MHGDNFIFVLQLCFSAMTGDAGSLSPRRASTLMQLVTMKDRGTQLIQLTCDSP